MSSEGNVRASDTDRDQVAEVLHTAYAEGRISLAEHEERVSAALAARTFDDLTGLTADLVPMETPAAPPQLSVVPGTVSISGDPPGQTSRTGSPRYSPRATVRGRGACTRSPTRTCCWARSLSI